MIDSLAPLAHAGHWLESLAFVAPVVLLPLALAAVILRERWRERGRIGQSS